MRSKKNKKKLYILQYISYCENTFNDTIELNCFKTLLALP